MSKIEKPTTNPQHQYTVEAGTQAALQRAVSAPSRWKNRKAQKKWKWNLSGEEACQKRYIQGMPLEPPWYACIYTQVYIHNQW